MAGDGNHLDVFEVNKRLFPGVNLGNVLEANPPEGWGLKIPIEVVDDRWNDYRSMDVGTLIADDFFGAGCVLGKPVAAWHELDLASTRGTMSINGHEVGSGIGGDIMGHPFEALAWLANNSARHGTPLRAGEFVFLGSIVETKWIEWGDIVEIEVKGLGTATARFV